MNTYFTIAERVGIHPDYQSAWKMLGDLVQPVDIKLGKFAAIPIKGSDGKYYYFYVYRETRDNYETYVSRQEHYYESYDDAKLVIDHFESQRKDVKSGKRDNKAQRIFKVQGADLNGWKEDE